VNVRAWEGENMVRKRKVKMRNELVEEEEEEAAIVA